MKEYLILFIFIQFPFSSANQCLLRDRPLKAALILARGGSKGIPLKNLALLDGVSLLGRALRVIHEAALFQEVWVSTDHDLIASEAEKYNASVHYRSEAFARDETSSIESVREFLQCHTNIESLSLVQCTSPFLRPEYLITAMSLFQDRVDCVFSVRHSFELRWMETEDNRIVAGNFNPADRPRRQDWRGEYVENGMFYFSRSKVLLGGRFQNQNCRVVIVPKKDCLEIDSEADLFLAKTLLHSRGGYSH